MSRNKTEKTKKPRRVERHVPSKSVNAQSKKEGWSKLSSGIQTGLARILGLAGTLITCVQSKKERWNKRIVRILTRLVAILGLVGTLYTFSARIEVTSNSPLNPDDPFSSPFTISNKSILPIYNVLFS